MSSTDGGSEASASHALYAYCLLAAPAAPSAQAAPAGLPGAATPRLLAAGAGRWLVVAEAPLERYNSEAIASGLGDLAWVSACAVAHEAVIEHFMSRTDPAAALLPMKLFTLFASERSALEHLAKEDARTGRLLRRLAGSVELGVRVLFDPAKVPAAPAPSGEREPPSGRAFLERKQRQRDSSKRALEAARLGAAVLFDDLAGVAKGARRLETPAGPPLGSLLLDAAFLCARKSQPRFEAVLDAGAARLRGVGCEVVLTGPWPGYHFLEEA